MSTLKEICKEQTEMIDEMRQNIRELTKESNQYKSERDTLIDDIAVLKANISRLERENEDLKFTKKMHLGHIKYFSNNNELLRDEVKSLKQENTQLKESRDWDYEYIVKVNEENKRLERENEKLKVKRNLFFERWKFKSEMYTELYEESAKYINLLSEFSEHIGNKPSSSMYKYFREKLDGIGIKEGE
ncbi:hypothetical protein [Staphylococcus xylosus]|uniref:hypothetical protein n=1 Tax=Staphylococcus xylosus TaxID=1288 RepID=UPI003CFA35BB